MKKNLIKMERKKYQGFTLLEVVLVVIIIALVSVITLTAVSVGKTKNNLRTARAEIVSTIKLAQSYALQGKTISTGEAPCGFGFMFIDESHYRIFFIPSESGMTCEEKNDSSVYRQYIDESNSPTLEEYEIKNNVILKSGTDLSNTEIYFTIPHANVYGGSGGVYGGALITLTNLDGDVERDIDIDARGSIKEE